ncbi:hypothetical protein EV127DRAFT_433204 [Xylaria flabelliformis]|nr:hypothetical protein EV127DRAFT_433204 [Xylaria flabelliformis]
MRRTPCCSKLLLIHHPQLFPKKRSAYWTTSDKGLTGKSISYACSLLGDLVELARSTACCCMLLVNAVEPWAMMVYTSCLLGTCASGVGLRVWISKKLLEQTLNNSITGNNWSAENMSCLQKMDATLEAVLAGPLTCLACMCLAFGLPIPLVEADGSTVSFKASVLPTRPEQQCIENDVSKEMCECDFRSVPQDGSKWIRALWSDE